MIVSLEVDRSLYSAPAISPTGDRVYVMYEAVTSPWRGDDMTSPRPYHGVFRMATIGADGRVKDAKVLRSIPLLDQAALDAVKQWQFTPTLLNGVPVPVIMTVTVNFTLQ